MTQRNSIIRMTETNNITLTTQQYHTDDLKSIVLMTKEKRYHSGLIQYHTNFSKEQYHPSD